MSKPVKSVQEVLEEIKAKNGKNGKVVINKFSRKKFDALMRAIFNDPTYTVKQAIVKDGQLVETVDIAVSDGFRKFCKKNILEKFKVDSAESARILDKDFTIDSVDGLYDFFVSAMYAYIDAGNKFDLIAKEDFKGSIFVKEMPASTKEVDVFHPQTREALGRVRTEKEPFKQLRMKSACPAYLKKRTKIK